VFCSLLPGEVNSQATVCVVLFLWNARFLTSIAFGQKKRRLVYWFNVLACNFGSFHERRPLTSTKLCRVYNTDRVSEWVSEASNNKKCVLIAAIPCAAFRATQTRNQAALALYTTATAIENDMKEIALAAAAEAFAGLRQPTACAEITPPCRN
jgi:hypothetical protein